MSNGNSGGAGIALAMVGLIAMSASAGSAAYFLIGKEEEEGTPTPTPTPTPTSNVIVLTPDSVVPSNCQGDTMVMKKGCHNTETGEVYDGTPDKCGPGKELWVPDPAAPGYVAAVGDGTCAGELRDCESECPAPCSGGFWIDDPSDYCKIVTYDNSNPPQKVVNANACGTGIRSQILDETRGNFVEARGLGACTKERVGSCTIPCPPGVNPTDGCSYYADRQKSANGCMKVDANGDALQYSPDGSNNVDCGESGKQEFFYLPINSSTCNRLSEWEPCTGEPCKVHCVGNWRQASPSNPEGWEACTGTCGEQPQKMRKYHISQGAQHGGEACEYPDMRVEYMNCGSIQPCCEIGEWQDGECRSDGYMTSTRTLTENKSGACAIHDAQKEERCCYQKGNWTAQGTCAQHQSGKQKYTQTVAGNCPSGTEAKYEDCAPCQYHTIESVNKFCQTYETANYGSLSWSTYNAAARAFKNVIDVPAVGTGGCPGTSIDVVKVGNDCSGTVGRVNELGGWNFGEEPDSTSDSQRESVVMANGGWT
jgi:hypothetical protein